MDEMTGGDWMEPGWSGDASEAAKMEPFNPGASSGMTWWQSMIAYGASRAIDNRFGPTNVQGNTNPGSFAGQNGRSYQQGPTPTAGEMLGGSGSLILLAGGALLAYALLG